jgi:hypothetical protein
MLEKFKLAIKREVIIYIAMLFVLTLLMHSDLLSNPSPRFELMNKKGNYSHPFIYTFVIYSILLIIRKILDFIIGLFEKKSN